MKVKTLRILGLALFLISIISERVVADTTNSTRVVRGELIYVLCASGVNIRSENLNDVLFTTGKNERITPFQGWGENKKTKIVNGREYNFVKVQFQDDSNRSTDIGWVADAYVKLKSDCAGSELPQVSLAGDPLRDIRGLDDPKCCLFPIKNHPEASYTTGARQFGAGRRTKTGGYRAHAATDLYADLYSDIRAVAPGVIVMSAKDFYMHTFQIAVKHVGGFVVRYGEITPRKLVRGLEENSRVRTGQTIGYVGQTIWPDGSKRAHPMLHLELFSGRGSGALSTNAAGRGSFYRRSDLMNPTKYVQNWENDTF